MATSIDIVKNPDAAPVDLNKFAEIVILKWQYNIVQKNLVYSGDLLRSFEYAVAGDSNGNTALISFVFNYYLRMLEMGVGKGSPIGEKSNRRQYAIFSKTFYGEVYRLSELVALMYANQGASIAAFGVA